MRERLRAAFLELRAMGYWARSNQDGGWDAVPEDVIKRSGKVVFWSDHETKNAFNAAGDLVGRLHLEHRFADAPELVRVLTQYGIPARLAGSPLEPEVVVEPPDKVPHER